MRLLKTSRLLGFVASLSGCADQFTLKLGDGGPADGLWVGAVLIGRDKAVASTPLRPRESDMEFSFEKAFLAEAERVLVVAYDRSVLEEFGLDVRSSSVAAELELEPNGPRLPAPARLWGERADPLSGKLIEVGPAEFSNEWIPLGAKWVECPLQLDLDWDQTSWSESPSNPIQLRPAGEGCAVFVSRKEKLGFEQLCPLEIATRPKPPAIASFQCGEDEVELFVPPPSPRITRSELPDPPDLPSALAIAADAERLAISSEDPCQTTIHARSSYERLAEVPGACPTWLEFTSAGLIGVQRERVLILDEPGAPTIELDSGLRGHIRATAGFVGPQTLVVALTRTSTCLEPTNPKPFQCGESLRRCSCARKNEEGKLEGCEEDTMLYHVDLGLRSAGPPTPLDYPVTNLVVLGSRALSVGERLRSLSESPCIDEEFCAAIGSKVERAIAFDDRYIAATFSRGVALFERGNPHGCDVAASHLFESHPIELAKWMDDQIIVLESKTSTAGWALSTLSRSELELMPAGVGGEDSQANALATFEGVGWMAAGSRVLELTP
ncbi:MAG: hypothetical protein HYV07_30385 [Deltaproteobacteria bacterium]|nr:hypothetical protein [Deltaproteobacteria bacterium]